MGNIWNSIAFRLSLICGMLVIASVILLSTAFYFGTIGMLEHGADEMIGTISKRLTHAATTSGIEYAAKKIDQALSDRIDSDTEIYLIADASGRKIAGNIPMWTDHIPPVGKIIVANVIRDGRASEGRLLLRRLPSGALLVVGRNMSDLREISSLVRQAIGVGALLTLALSIAGTIFFRVQIERKVGAIRHAALDIEAGNLSRRIPLSGESDEFARLARDLNRMLDRIEHLMEGVRHVSNTIAHNLRTPLGRIRGHLDEALRANPDAERLITAGNFAIGEIDGLITLLNKLLEIAEAESRTRRQVFQPISLTQLIEDMVELYDAAAEEMGITITAEIKGNPIIHGDRDLLASALSNLLDNALKYAGRTATIGVRASRNENTVTIVVYDNGPGIPKHEHLKVLQRFYRLDHQRQGYGIGLSAVSAIVSLHDGTLELEDASPGLLVRMTFLYDARI